MIAVAASAMTGTQGKSKFTPTAIVRLLNELSDDEDNDGISDYEQCHQSCLGEEPWRQAFDAYLSAPDKVLEGHTVV